ncbi:hypothetical protein ONZ45_g16108 [Pleurotus djamor]|nr:hypothetical protein ONZ45_g16108 [Pleurotus djamor]
MDPLRPASSTALWAHLLRKDTPSSTPGASYDAHNPPIAPLDRTGTSMRMLLHDTQANFETFSSRIDTVASTIEATKHEIVTVKSLFDEQSEKLSMEMVDLVNRSQREIQKSLSSPAQANDLETIRKDISFTGEQIRSLDKRLDAIHLLYQGHNQNLQSIQDQQQAILTAILPLLPLLQALPLRIDSAKDQITANIAQHIAPLAQRVESASTCFHDSSPTVVHGSSSGPRGTKRLRSPSSSSEVVSPEPQRSGAPLRLPRDKKASIDANDPSLPSRSELFDATQNDPRGNASAHADANIPQVHAGPTKDSHRVGTFMPPPSPVPQSQSKITSLFPTSKQLPASILSSSSKPQRSRIPLADLPSRSGLTSNNPLHPNAGLALHQDLSSVHDAAQENSPPPRRLKPPYIRPSQTARSSTKSHIALSLASMSDLTSFKPPLNLLPPTKGKQASPSQSAFATPARSNRRSSRIKPSPRSSTATTPARRPVTRSATLMLTTTTSAEYVSTLAAPSIKDRKRSIGKRFIPLDDDDDDDDKEEDEEVNDVAYNYKEELLD